MKFPSSMVVVGVMKFVYTCMLIAGLLLLLSWAPYQGEYDPWWGAATNHSGVAGSEFANKHGFALSAVLIGLSIIGLIRESTVGGMRKALEPGPPLNFDRMKFFYALLVAAGLILLFGWLGYRAGVPRYPSEWISPEARMAVRRAANAERFALSAVLIGLAAVGLIRESMISRMRRKIDRTLHRMAALRGESATRELLAGRHR